MVRWRRRRLDPFDRARHQQRLSLALDRTCARRIVVAHLTHRGKVDRVRTDAGARLARRKRGFYGALRVGVKCIPRLATLRAPVPLALGGGGAGKLLRARPRWVDCRLAKGENSPRLELAIQRDGITRAERERLTTREPQPVCLMRSPDARRVLLIPRFNHEVACRTECGGSGTRWNSDLCLHPRHEDELGPEMAAAEIEFVSVNVDRPASARVRRLQAPRHFPVGVHRYMYMYRSGERVCAGGTPISPQMKAEDTPALSL